MWPESNTNTANEAYLKDSHEADLLTFGVFCSNFFGTLSSFQRHLEDKHSLPNLIILEKHALEPVQTDFNGTLKTHVFFGTASKTHLSSLLTQKEHYRF